MYSGGVVLVSVIVEPLIKDTPYKGLPPIKGHFAAYFSIHL